MKKLKAAILIQSNLRGLVERRNYRRTRQLVIRLQAAARAQQCRKKYHQLKNASILLQRRVRANIAARNARQEFVEAKRVVVKLQSLYRDWKARCFVCKLKAVLLIQRWFRANMTGTRVREEYHRIKEAVIVLQSAYRGFRGRMIARNMRAARVIQSAVRGFLTRRKIDVRIAVVYFYLNFGRRCNICNQKLFKSKGN